MFIMIHVAYGQTYTYNYSTLEIALTVLLSMVLMTRHMYDPANALVTLGTLYTPRTAGTGIPF